MKKDKKFELGIEIIRKEIFNFTIKEMCKHLNVSMSAYNKNKKWGKIEIYRPFVVDLFKKPEVILHALRNEGAILKEWVERSVYFMMAEDIRGEDLNHVFHIFCKFDDEVLRIQSAIFIGRIASRLRLNDKGTLFLLQMKEREKRNRVFWGIYTGLVLLEYEQIYLEFLQEVLVSNSEEQKELLEHYYGGKVIFLNSVITMLNAHEHIQGHIFYAIILLYLYRCEITTINNDPGNYTNYIPLIKQGLIELKKKPLYLNVTNYQQQLHKMIEEIEKEIFI